jgi:lantibiotic modifying enzyme
MRTFFAAVLVLAVTPAKADCAELAVDSERPYLAAAQSAAAHLRSIARREPGDGLSWPVADTNTSRTTGIDVGAAGIGLFFLDLYATTHSSDDLLTAEQASSYVFAQYRSRGPGLADWLAGAAGGGELALRLYRATGRDVHLANAQWAGDWLANAAVRDGDGEYWRYPDGKIFTGRYHGAAGVGLFLLDLFEATRDDKYLRHALSAARWIERYIVRFDGDTIGWKRITTEDIATHSFCVGTAGILDFLERIAGITGDEHYRDLFTRAANGLLRQAIPQPGDGLTWTYTSARTGGYPVIFCHGSASTAVVLYRAWEFLGDSRFLDAARRGASWTESVSIQSPTEGRYWPHIYQLELFETGYETGAASVGHALLEMNAIDPREDYVRQAAEAAAYLLAIADRPAEGQLRWINYTSPETPSSVHRYENGWYAGTAGIGIFFVELDRAMSKLTP